MAAIIPHIIDQHAEETAFLWLLRNNAVHAPHYDLNDLVKLDDRVDAHLDGLRIAGEYGWQACVENLQFKDSGEVFAAAVIALEMSSTERIDLVYKVVEEAPEAIEGLVSAFGWTEPQYLKQKVKALLESTNPLWRGVGISACSVHRVDPGKFLEQAIVDEDVQLRVRAVKLVGELGRVDLKTTLLEQLKHDNKHIRFWSSWSAVLTGDREQALYLLTQNIESNSEFCIPAMQLALPILDSLSVKKTLKVLADNKETLRLAIIGAGISGDSCYLPWLIQQMNIAEHARVACDAFSHICGLDLGYQDMEADLPENASAGPTEDPDDENVAMDPDEDLPCPNALLVLEWWQKNKPNFKPEVRYLYGKPANECQCKWLLINGTQRLRYAAALTLALIQPGQALFEVRAVGKKQQKTLNC
ncbi:MAG: TIGR02270 family protein [Methylococcaceae bacterium]|nr:TIGR02270 family protein [Methylococcaceae bacterium]